MCCVGKLSQMLHMNSYCGRAGDVSLLVSAVYARACVRACGCLCVLDFRCGMPGRFHEVYVYVGRDRDRLHNTVHQQRPCGVRNIGEFLVRPYGCSPA